MLTLRELLGSSLVFDGVPVAYHFFPASCVTNIASVSGLSILDCPFGYFIDFVLTGAPHVLYRSSRSDAIGLSYWYT
jgi:hypothetical protein